MHYKNNLSACMNYEVFRCGNWIVLRWHLNGDKSIHAILIGGFIARVEKNQEGESSWEEFEIRKKNKRSKMLVNFSDWCK